MMAYVLGATVWQAGSKTYVFGHGLLRYGFLKKFSPDLVSSIAG
jgi:hypothetical protein